jgi:two-component system, OmpR family, sensor kinase
MRIRTKLILWYSGLLALIIIIFGVIVYAFMDRTLINAIDSTLDETATQVIRNSRIQRFGEFGGPIETLIRLPRLDIFRASDVGVQVWGVNHDEPQLLDISANLGDWDQPLDESALGSDQPRYSNVKINEREMRVLTRPLTAQGNLYANVQVVALLDTVNEAREKLLLVMASSAFVGILGSIILGMWLSRKALRPIERITEAASKIAQADDLSTRLAWNGPMDELGRLTKVFNGMMERLQDLFRVQQRFVADVSHELRTPLTAIRGNLDLIKRYGVDDESLEAIESEAERMSRMVNDLLLLARADYGGLTLELEPIDLDTIVIEAHQQAKILTKDRNIVISIDHFEPARIAGHVDRMKQLLLNLVGNAIKFTPDGGRISLSLRQSNGKAILQVKDTGIGISLEDTKHIFDRFYQADKSRFRMGDSSGLGLAIAKWIVEAHHGSISVESEVGKGSTFTVEIPLLGDSHHTGDDDQPVSRLRHRLMPER